MVQKIGYIYQKLLSTNYIINGPQTKTTIGTDE